MVLVQDASFEKPRQKNWRNKFVQLDFHTSIAELEKAAKNLRKQGKAERKYCRSKKEWLNQKWLLTAFLKKCDCPICKKGWQAFEKTQGDD